MNHVERQLALPEYRLQGPPSVAQLPAFVDAFHRSTLSPDQTEIVHTLREGIGMFVEMEAASV